MTDDILFKVPTVLGTGACSHCAYAGSHLGWAGRLLLETLDQTLLLGERLLRGGDQPLQRGVGHLQLRHLLAKLALLLLGL